MLLEMSSTPEDDAVNIVETTKDLEYYTNLVDKTVAGFEKFILILEKSYTMVVLVRKKISSTLLSSLDWSKN